jgi:hypothetical protein
VLRRLDGLCDGLPVPAILSHLKNATILFVRSLNNYGKIVGCTVQSNASEAHCRQSSWQIVNLVVRLVCFELQP